MRDAKKRDPAWIREKSDVNTVPRKPRYRLADLLAQMPPGPLVLDEEMRAWESAPPIGKEIL